jgi:succinate-semialdehyde dehydrogenase/glutarate-semialdehyde dehydrogenase
MTLEMGKPVAESKAEIAYAAEFFRWFAEEAVRIDGRYASPQRQGPAADDEAAGRPVPADHALELPDGHGHRKIGPAVAAGCTMVIKPASQTPAVDARAGRILEEAGCPAGCSTSSPPSGPGR